MGGTGTADHGRPPGSHRSWRDAYTAMSTADRRQPLDPSALHELAVAAYLVGEDAVSTDAWTRAHHASLAVGDASAAARCAFWLGWTAYTRGQHAQADGWFSRARGLLADRDEQAEHGLLLVTEGLIQIGGGDLDGAQPTFARVLEIGERCADPDVTSLGRFGLGQILIRRGDVRGGVRLLDEAMVSVTAGEVSPMVAGTLYCAVLLECNALFDLARASEWTDAVTAWCGPDMVPFRGQCLVHRSELMQLRGAWATAMDEAERAADLLRRPPPQPAVGMALFQQAELHRLRGEFAAAEEGYAEASRWGREPQPGLALLRLAQGRVDTAWAAIRRAADDAPDQLARARLLGAVVEIGLAAGDVGAASSAATELAEVAATLDAPFLHAEAAAARGAVLLAEQEHRGALKALRQAAELWQRLDAPHHLARARSLAGLACAALGDHDGARLERQAARALFEQLGAVTDLQRVVSGGHAPVPTQSGLSAREVQVLAQLASGRTNREIADALVISPKTVERHVSNIFTKLGVPNRAAATAYAYEHDLV